jgi:phage shock protein PspC (stress-responsive transcriptional regulator)
MNTELNAQILLVTLVIASTMVVLYSIITWLMRKNKKEEQK